MIHESEPAREQLVDHLRRAFPHLIEHPGSEGGIEGLASRAHWSALLGCWLTSAWGMTIGVERDGYVHS